MQMANKRLSMRKTKEILRLRDEGGLSVRKIAHSLGISVGAVQSYLRAARRAGIKWPLPAGLNEEGLHELLYGEKKAGNTGKPLPEMACLHKELKRKDVTLQLLWEEYRKDHPDGYSYPQLCRYYRQWAGKLDVSIRQAYRAGEKMFVDWAGPTIPVTDPVNGQIKQVCLFVAALGASNYTYAEAFLNRQLPFWIEGHIHSFEYFGGVAAVIVPDNEKTGVTHACRYEPGLNPTYQDLAEHYHTIVIPTRPREPRDKSKVEAAVLFAERWIIAALRHTTFFNLPELNVAIRGLLEKLNRRPFKKMAGSRVELFEQLDRPALQALPAQRYEFAEWRKAKVNIDYHVQADNHFYSVPYSLVHEDVDVRLTVRTVEILHKGSRVAVHAHSFVRGQATTIPEHRPKSHQKHLEWTPSRLIHWAGTVGPNCAAAVEQILSTQLHPEMGYRSCLGIMRLSRSYQKPRMEAACQRAVYLKVCSYRSIKSILQTGLDAQALDQEKASAWDKPHENIRGKTYYAKEGTG
jgi:transposase